MRKLKQQMVDYKGGCCQKCGYNKYIGALEFHHINPEEKDFNPSSLKKYTMDTRITEELDKCILLCSNCHRETHHEINEKKKELC
jgi:5-methylcytosine-specific restriction endonuclease McrA